MKIKSNRLEVIKFLDKCIKSKSVPEFLDMDLSYVDLSELNFEGSNFQGCNLMNVNFSGSNLQNSNFEDANLMNANFTNANMSNTMLYGSNLMGASLQFANLQGADIRDANLKNIKIKNTNLVDLQYDDDQDEILFGNQKFEEFSISFNLLEIIGLYINEIFSTLCFILVWHQFAGNLNDQLREGNLSKFIVALPEFLNATLFDVALAYQKDDIFSGVPWFIWLSMFVPFVLPTRKIFYFFWKKNKRKVN
jgi:uncharacterized protein YjbI with pentapeptide repeats